MTGQRPSDWSSAQSGPYSVPPAPSPHVPSGGPSPATGPTPYGNQLPGPGWPQPAYAPAPSPYAPPHAPQYAHPQAGIPGGSPYAAPQPNPYMQPNPYAPNPYMQPTPYAPSYQQPYTYGYAPYMARPEAPSANTAMIVGIISLCIGALLCTPVGLLGIVAVITGNRAKREIRESNNYFDGKGKATAALVTGWIAIAIGAIGVVIVVLAILSADFSSGI